MCATRQRTAWAVLLMCLLHVELHTQEVIRIPAGHSLTQSSLLQRWKWAQQEAQQRKLQQSYWVGFSVVRLMEEGSFYNTHYSRSSEHKQTVEEMVYGTSHQSYKNNREEYDPSSRYKKVQKDIAVLFRFPPRITSSGKPEKVSAGNIGLPFDAMEYPIIWIGGANGDESVELLIEQYSASSSIEYKSTIIGIMGWHEQSPKVYSILNTVLQSTEADELRKKAAISLGGYDDRKTIGILEQTATSDRSTGVAENAVHGLGRMGSDDAVEALIRLAKTVERDGVRKKAVHNLSRYATENVVTTLNDIVLNDKDLELQKQAVYALTRMKQDDHIPQLISLATTHPHGEIRKYAIHLLGQSKDRRALDALIDIVKK